MSQVVSTFDKYEVDEKYNGYLRLVKMKDVINSGSGTSIVTETVQTHGLKRIIFSSSGSHDIMRFKNMNTYGDGIDLTSMDYTEFDTVMTSGISKGGTYSGVGTFDPEEGEDILVNIEGHHIIRSNPSGYTIEMYDSGFTKLVSQININNDGNMSMSGIDSNSKETMVFVDINSGVTVKTIDSSDKEYSVIINKSSGTVTLKSDTHSLVLSGDGTLTITATTLQFNISDLIVSGNLQVQQDTQLNTLSTSGKAQLEGTNIVSS